MQGVAVPYSDQGISFWRLVGAIVVALVLVSIIDAVATFGAFAWYASYASAQLEKAVFQVDHDAKERAVVAAQDRLHAQVQSQEKQRQQQASYDAAHALKVGEACVGGTVVAQTWQANGTPSYVQVLESGRPVACSGDRRL